MVALLAICQSSASLVVNCDEQGDTILSAGTSRAGDPELLIAGEAVNVDCRPTWPVMCTNARFCDKRFWTKKV